MKKIACFTSLLFVHGFIFSQFNWVRVDSLFTPLPSSVQVWMCRDSVEGKPGIAFALVADLKDRNLEVIADTAYKRRLTPAGFFEKNSHPLAVVNTSFFSFSTHQNLNAIIQHGKLVAYNNHSLPGKGKDTLTWRHPLSSALGFSKERQMDIAWLFTDSSQKLPLAIQLPVPATKDSSWVFDKERFIKMAGTVAAPKIWKMQTAVAGGPVLLQQGEIKISNNEELKFAGKAILDRHPRTAMGYTAYQQLVILVVEGRNPGTAEGVTLLQEAAMLQSLGCVEALNFDGGGSSCLLIHGKETIRPSDKEGQRAVPGVLLISYRKN